MRGSWFTGHAPTTRHIWVCFFLWPLFLSSFRSAAGHRRIRARLQGSTTCAASFLLYTSIFRIVSHASLLSKHFCRALSDVACSFLAFSTPCFAPFLFSLRVNVYVPTSLSLSLCWCLAVCWLCLDDKDVDCPPAAGSLVTRSRTGTCPHFGFLQRRETGGDNVMCRGVCAAHFFFVSLRSPGFSPSPLFFLLSSTLPRAYRYFTSR